jgi:MFS transporter, DHA2 family, multidrug resistance protein
MTVKQAAPRPGRREWVGLAVLALACLLHAMDLSVLYLAVPSLSADLQPSSAQLLWITDIYGFLLAGSLLTMGTLGDRIGRRRLLLTGAAAFGIASVLAASATSAGMLIAARALLGLAGATLAPSTLSLLRTMFADPRQRTLAIAVWIASFQAGGAVGPLLGGVLLEWFWWGSVFLLAVPPMVLLLVLGPVLLPEYRDPNAGRLDLASAALSVAAVLLAIWGLKQLAQEGLDWPSAIAVFAGLLIGMAFVGRQRRLADPLLDLSLFRSAAFSASLVTYLLGLFIAFGVFWFTAQYLQQVLGLSPLVAGLWTVPTAGALIIGSLLTPLLARRARPGWVMAAGMVVAAVGLGLLTQVAASAGLAVVVAGTVVFSLGLAPVVTLATDLIVGAAPPQRAGAAAGLSETSAELGGALGIAVLGSIGAAVYRGQAVDAIPAGLPAQAAAAARDTLGGALAVAGQLPEQLGASLLAAAQEAFTQALQVTAALGAALAIALAILAAALLRGVRPGSQPDQQPGPSQQEAGAARPRPPTRSCSPAPRPHDSATAAEVVSLDGSSRDRLQPHSIFSRHARRPRRSADAMSLKPSAAVCPGAGARAGRPGAIGFVGLSDLRRLVTTTPTNDKEAPDGTLGHQRRHDRQRRLRGAGT